MAGTGPGPASSRRRRRWASRAVSALAGIAVAGALVVPAASADVGGLVYAGCIGRLAGCNAVVPAAALDGAEAVTVVGNQLYATSYGSSLPGSITDGLGAVSHFSIDAAGNPVYAGCIGNFPGCTATSPAQAVSKPAALAADGGQLYVASYSAGTISRFTIDATGNLIFAGCYGALAGCTPVPAGVLDQADGLAITPDGQQLYAASAGAVSHFTIDSYGNLIFAGCIGDLAGCATMTAGAAGNADAVAITGDGANVYVSAFTGTAISHFTVDVARNLIYAGCIGNHPGCTAITTAGALSGPIGLAVTDNGANLYATAFWANAVSHFTIAGFTTANPPGGRGPGPIPCKFACR
jgi:DNA-binding beta-propeller fold protein YncE